ncbi:MAG: LysR family transcriptional regulator [Bacilli bacterium]|nr:LysR family transcriptional regulator [Bacilli bacterium]MBQ6538678.1 LysR family transcriptional regulator [Bacilli bacterium]
MKTNLELYKVFYYVVKNRSITGASNELMVSQPAVTKSIKVLERDLNTTLFNRNKTGVTLTNAGELLYNKIKKSMDLIISAEEDITSLNNMEQGTINIGAGNTIMQRYLMPYIREFHELYPNINVIVHTVVTPELIKRAQVGLVDIVFTHLPNDVPSNFKIIKLKKLHDILVVNKDSKYKDKTISKNDLKELPLVLLPFDASNRKNFNHFCSTNNIVINPLMEIGNDLIIEDCALNGLGVGLVVREYVKNNLDNKNLFELKTSFNLKEKDLVYLIDSNRMNNTIVNNFIKLLEHDLEVI